MLDLAHEFQIHLLAEAQGSLIDTAFEALAERLQTFERLYFEMDGSFVWTGEHPLPWQLDGMVYDLGLQIQRVELKGQCPYVQWRKLLSALNHPQQILVAFNLKTSQFMSIDQFESATWSA